MLVSSKSSTVDLGSCSSFVALARAAFAEALAFVAGRARGRGVRGRWGFGLVDGPAWSARRRWWSLVELADEAGGVELEGCVAVEQSRSEFVFECVVRADAKVPTPTATTRSRRRSTASRVSARGRSTAKPGSSARASRCASPRARSTGLRIAAASTRFPRDRHPRRVRTRLLPRHGPGPRRQVAARPIWLRSPK
jgi:hypothetical protein